MLTAIKGTFRNGRVELDEDPGITDETAVVVTFLAPDPVPAATTPRPGITFGMFGRPPHRMSDLEDFKIAEHDVDDLADGPTT